MKRSISLVRLFTLALMLGQLTLNSCKKNSTVTPSITINGTNYPIVKIGNQTWTAINYNGPGGIADTSKNSLKAGKFYTASEANIISLPLGWRVPTEADYQGLLQSLGTVSSSSLYAYILSSDGTKHLKAKSNWDVNPGDNSTGFNAIAAGFGGNNFISRQHQAAVFWSSTVMPANGKTPASQYAAGIFGFTYTPIVDPFVNKNVQPVTVDETDIYALPDITDYRCSIRFVKDN